MGFALVDEELDGELEPHAPRTEARVNAPAQRITLCRYILPPLAVELLV